MALVTRPKPTVSHKKRRAQHHRHSKSYLGAYWPYLPMFSVLAGGVIVDKLWSAGVLPGVSNGLPATPALAGSGLTRIQVLAGSQASNVLAAVIIVSGVAFAIFVFRHGRRLQRLITKSETFVYQHAWFDTAMVLVFTVGFLLTRPIT
jgi:uncharacterized membrane protein YidH (DUF202 family)